MFQFTTESKFVVRKTSFGYTIQFKHATKVVLLMYAAGKGSAWEEGRLQWQDSGENSQKGGGIYLPLSLARCICHLLIICNPVKLLTQLEDHTKIVSSGLHLRHFFLEVDLTEVILAFVTSVTVITFQTNSE